MQDRSSSTTAESDLPERLAEAWPPVAWRDTEVGVAVSGGADSVALLRAVAEVKSQEGGRGGLSVLHLDHGLRGAASAQDAAFVRDLAGELGLRFRGGVAGDLPSTSEESLRDARRAFFRSAADALGFRYLATGHTADDQAETVLFRILRGSGLHGLRGIRQFPPLNDACTLVRPLLAIERAELEAYLDHLGQAYRVDASNRDRAYTRNWLRHEIMPAIRKRFPKADRQLIQLSEQAEEVGEVFTIQAHLLLGDSLLAPINAQRIGFDREALDGGPSALIREALRLAWREAGWPQQSMTRASWERLTDLVEQPLDDQKQAFPGGVTASTTSTQVVLARATET